MAKLETKEIKDLAVTVAKLASLTLAELNSKVSDAALAGIAALNTWTRKQTFQPSVAELAVEIQGFDATGKGNPGFGGLKAYGGDSVNDAGGDGVHGVAGDGATADGSGVVGESDSQGKGLYGKSSGQGYALYTESTDLTPEVATNLTIPIDADPSTGAQLGAWFTVSDAHPRPQYGRFRHTVFGLGGVPKLLDLAPAVNTWADVIELQTTTVAQQSMFIWIHHEAQTSYVVRVIVHAREVATGDVAAYEIKAVFDRGAGANPTLKFQSVIILHEDQAAWDAVLDVNVNAIRLRVTGENSKNIDWSAFVEIF